MGALTGHALCVPRMDTFYKDKKFVELLYGDESSPYAVVNRRIASRKGVSGDRWSEVSDTAKV